jgi:hypothetical protein
MQRRAKAIRLGKYGGSELDTNLAPSSSGKVFTDKTE